jgi:ABC-type transporter Mla subunit MlaD
METQRQEFRIGIMVLACLVSLTLMTVFFGSGRRPMLNFGGETKTIQVRFQRAPGINRNSPVFKNGVRIGRVTRVELVENDHLVEVTVSLDRDRKVYTDEECRIRQAVITGDASLEFVKRLNYTGKIEEVTPSFPPLSGIASSDLMSGISNIEGDVTRVIQSISGAAEHISTLAERLNLAIGTPEEFQAQKEKFEAVVEETRQTMASVRQTTDGIGQFVNDPAIQSNVRKVIADLPEIIGKSMLFVQEARTLVEKGNVSLDELSPSFEKISKLVDAISKIADQVEGDVPETITAIKRSAIQLESLFSELKMIVENFRNADGTLKRLIRDPEAYQKLLATLDNVEKITDEVNWMLQVDAKPIAHNVKILTDKAARDPSIFIRNLFSREAPIKTMPASFGGGRYA